MCSISKLCWCVAAVPSPTKCSGDNQEFGKLDEITKRTVVNRITPYRLDLSLFSEFSVCKFHQKWFTLNHPSLKQNKCSIVEESVQCTNTANYSKSVRVSLALSEQIFVPNTRYV